MAALDKRRGEPGCADRRVDLPDQIRTLAKWWSKAVNFISFLSLAALRTPANPWDTRASLCVECVLD